MPRRSSTGRSRPAPRSNGYTPARNPPKPVTPAPPPAQGPARGGSVMGGLGGVVAEGMAFGGGSAIAHRAVEAMMGPRVIQHETVGSSAPAPTSAPVQSATSLGSNACANQVKSFQECINSYADDVSKCQFYMDMLNECRRSSGSALSA